MDGHLIALYVGGPLAGATCVRQPDRVWSEYRDEAGADLDSEKGDAALALVVERLNERALPAHPIVGGYKLMARAGVTYYVNLCDYKRLERAATDVLVFARLVDAANGEGVSWRLHLI